MADLSASAKADVQDSAKQTPVRSELVDTAVRFLNNPKLQGASLNSRKEFLRKKGLLEAEVDLAIAKAKEANPSLGLEVVQAPPPHNLTPPPVAQRLVERKRSWKEYAFITVIIAGVSYVVVMVVKKYILPWFWGREEQFEQRMQTVHTAIQQTREELTQTADGLGEATKALQEVASEQRRLLGELSLSDRRDGSALEEVKTELSAIKGLILGRHQFPQPPTPTGKRRIPAWQQSVSLPAQVPSTDGKGEVLAEGKEETEPALVAMNGQGESSDDADKEEG